MRYLGGGVGHLNTRSWGRAEDTEHGAQENCSEPKSRDQEFGSDEDASGDEEKSDEEGTSDEDGEAWVSDDEGEKEDETALGAEDGEEPMEDVVESLGYAAL